MEITPHPTIERRLITTTKKKKLIEVNRYFVVGVPAFEGSQLHGFKSEESLMKCWTWWYNNIHLTGIKGKEARKSWRSGGREKFYNNNIPSKKKYSVEDLIMYFGGD